MYKFFPSDFFNFEFLRVLGTAPTLGSDVGESLDAAARIKNDDAESWYIAWTETAERSEKLGEQALSVGDRETARWAFMRSSNYRRASELYVRPLYFDLLLPWYGDVRIQNPVADRLPVCSTQI